MKSCALPPRSSYLAGTDIRRDRFTMLSLAMGLGLSLSFGTAASAAICKPSAEFNLAQRDNLTSTFRNTGDGSAIVSVVGKPRYGTANATYKSLDGGTRFHYRVRWPNGWISTYKIRVLDDNYGDGSVHTTGEGATGRNRVQFHSLGPVVVGC